MSTKRKAKKRKTITRVEKQVPDFDDVYNDILDSYALIHVGYQIILASSDDEGEEYKHAIVVMHQGVILLKKAANRFEEANSRLSTFCLQYYIEQEHLQGDAS